MNAFDYLFAETKTLDKSFVLGTNEETSFKKIYKDSLVFAYFLRRKVGEKQNIILISENSLFSIIAYLAILKSGNVCVPLDPSIEQGNLDYIIRQTDCGCVVVADKIGDSLNVSGRLLVTETCFKDYILGKNIEKVSILGDFDENRLAVILFTSGSTGVPKGVMLSHRNICANTDSILGYLHLNDSDIMGVVLPFYYCYGLSLLHTHLKVGGSLVLINSFIFLGSVIDNLKKYKCTGFAGVPSHFQILLKKSKKFLTTSFPHLRYVTQAGGKLHNVFIELFIDTFPSVAFYVMYGQTEATARLSYLPPDMLREKMGSIGKAIPGVTLRVVNSQGNPVEEGEVGEIIARGGNNMCGYFKDPEGTRGALKDGWLYTGDMAKVDHDGFIFIVARKKEIIKVGGKRISLKEIEAVILSIPEVMDCTIEGGPDELLGESTKATIVLTEFSDPVHMRENILKLCHEKLASYKIPQVISFEDNMSLSSAGKKIKKAVVI